MNFFKKSRIRFIAIIVLLIGVGAFFLFKEDAGPTWTTGVITTGDVRELISVSGVLESSSEATLTFSSTGIVGKINVVEGGAVHEGDLLAQLELGELFAEKRDAEGSLIIERANESELKNGPRSEERNITESEVQIAETNLLHTEKEEQQKVQNAYRALLSSDLEALPTDSNSEAVPPTISGTYTCDKEGTYTVSVFRSAAKSGYSYRLSGLESGTYTAYTEAPGSLGSCGLFITFEAGETYGNKTFSIAIPNTRSETYVTRANEYQLAQEQAENAIKTAKETLIKTEREALLANASPREEEHARADAAVLKAQARLDAVHARIREGTIISPLTGIVSDIELTRGETSNGGSITVVGSSFYELTVRIPEIDITRVSEGQSADVIFDARPEEPVQTTVSFISETATEIDGVAYFEAVLRFANPPSWFRSGLNADVDITVEKREKILRVPKRFIVKNEEKAYLLYPQGKETRKEMVDILFTGNDGYVAINGNIKDGDTIVAP